MSKISEQHTPGPWFHGKPADGGRINVYAGESMSLRVCRVDSDADFGNHCAANARLIAAAPELMQAARRTVALIEVWRSTGCAPSLRQWEELHDINAAAIAAARGQA